MRCLIETKTEREALAVVNLLKRTRVPDDLYISDFYGNILEADLAAPEAEQLRKTAIVYEDAQLEPFAGGSDEGDDPQDVRDDGADEWKRRTLIDVLKQIQAPHAWFHSVGEGVTIIIIDSGIHGAAAEFPRWKRAGQGISFSYPDQCWVDNEMGHGTMSGCVSAAIRFLGGHYDGVAPFAKVLSCRTDFHLNDVFKIFSTILSMRRKQQLRGPCVINCSYGWGGCLQPAFPSHHPLARAVKDCVAEGITIVCAAGNNHSATRCSFDPRADGPNTIWGINSMDEVICVGAVDWNGDNRFGWHSKSSRGPGQFAVNSSKPDVVAPCYGQVLWGSQRPILAWWGTSGAAPLVSGLAALVLSRTSGSLKPAEIKRVIEEGCTRLGGARTRVGAGMINCLKTMTLLG